jgi:ABC-2 type transport system permease protein
MVVAFVLPVLLGLGLARCAPAGYYLTALMTVVPFVVIPTALGCLVTLGLVSVFPARRARDVLMLMGLLFAVGLVLLIRFLRPERLLSVQSLPDVTAFFATLQSPVTPFLPSFWAGESLFAALRGEIDALHLGALWTTAAALTVIVRAAYGRQHFAAWSKAQESRKARFTRFATLDRLLRPLPMSAARRALLVKDLKVFLRDTTQWSQLLLLVALALIYVYNFRVLDLDRIPYMSRVVKNVYAFVNLAMAAFVTAAVAVRFVFPAVSAEGAAFWIVRTSPVSLRSFLWSKLWTGLVPILLLAEALTIASNHLLGVGPFLRVLGACAIAFMTLGLVGLACGMGAEHPRFAAENPTQVAGSYGGVAFMVLAVLYILATVGLLAWPASIYLWHEYRGLPIPAARQVAMAAALSGAACLSVFTFTTAMRRGVRALEALG